MSFSVDVKKELISAPVKQTCCKKALLFGLLYNSTHIKDTHFTCEFGILEAAETARHLLGNQGENTIGSFVRGGRTVYTLAYSSKAFAAFISWVSKGEGIAEAAKFRCPECSICFLRGVLIAGATITDPAKGYHLEIPILNLHTERVEPLRRFFADMDVSANTVTREKKTSLYFKSNTAISDILSYAGARRSGFLMANTYIERDIRNNENRATNFVAKNISKSVTATQKQIAAINKLRDMDKLSTLPAELLQTAMLRVENDAVSLSELALLHDPPISKSGLNHRLEKICKFSEEF